MSYTVLARKYRPQSFHELVGQEHIARTLSNAIASGRVAHAFLFTGVRGVGKTTTARLLAKSLCCTQGPTSQPCNECDPCREIASGVDMDVLEIDGASNNSVEDVRRLQETLPYRPSRNRFKIVIVDEVHMLSQGAFNAFLKTLEEPPEHVKFIFATTEAHRVPVTIRSRCQRYDFRLIPQSVIARRTRELLENESIDADEGTVAIVAREAAGSMRDALTLLDQLVAFSGTTLRAEDVAQTLGIAARKQVHDAVRATLVGDGATALRAVDGLARQGADMLHATRQILEMLRDLVVLRVAGDDGELVDLVEEERRTASELAGQVDELELQRAFAAMSKLLDDVARSAAPKTVLEMGLVRIATRPPLRAVGDLVARLEELERRLTSGSPGGPRGPGSGGGRRPGPRRAGHASSAGAPAPDAGSPGPRASETDAVAPAAPAPQATDRAPPRAVAPAASPAPGPATASAQPPAAPANAPAANAPAATPAPASPSPDPSAPPAASEAPAGPSAAPAAAAAKPEPAQPPERSYTPREKDDAPPAEVDMRSWQRIVETLRDEAPAHAAIVDRAYALAVSARRLQLGFEEGGFYGRQAQAGPVQDALAQAAEQVLGDRPSIEIKLLKEVPQGHTSVAELQAQQREDRKKQKEKQALEHPRVRDAIRVFPEAEQSAEVHVELD